VKRARLLWIPLVLVAIAAAGYGFIDRYWVDFSWQRENRAMLSEHVAPDSSWKVGVYMYDVGALGYSTVNVSLVAIGEDYPIEANLFKTDEVPASVEWTDARNVIIRVDSDYAKSQARSEPPANARKGPVLVRYEMTGRTH